VSFSHLLGILQLRSEKSELEGTLMKEQEHQMEKLMKRIDRLQNEVSTKQSTLEQVLIDYECSILFTQLN
jgi:Uncharacterized conserved protein H4 (DUF2046)